MKKCHFCDKEIQDSAKKCRYCGKWLQTKENPGLPMPQESENNDISGDENQEERYIAGSCCLFLVYLYRLLQHPGELGEVAGEIMYVMNLLILFYAVIGGLVIYLIILFFKKSKYTPKVYITFLVINFIVPVCIVYLIYSAGGDPDAFIRPMGNSFISIMVWGLYFQKSIRVKNTFIH